MNGEDRAAIAALLEEQRWGALATLRDDGSPLASSVAFALDLPEQGLLLHLSRLAEHTRNLLERPAASLVVGTPDTGAERDPQTLARLSLQGEIAVVGRDAPGYAAARDAYLARLPDAAPRFGFGDFELLRLRPAGAQFVGGFARARGLGASGLREVFADIAGRAGATPARRG